MIQPNREELAWAAGFFDGEGCTVQRHIKGNVYPALSVSQVERAPLERFQRAVGGLGTIGKAYQYGRMKNSIQHWHVSSFTEVQAVIAMLWGFLCQPKRDQYKRVLALAKENPDWFKSYAQKQQERAVAYWSSPQAATRRKSNGVK